MSEVDQDSLETTSRNAPDVEMGDEEETLAQTLEAGEGDDGAAEDEPEEEEPASEPRLTFVE
jgi:hypothetical protein